MNADGRRSEWLKSKRNGKKESHPTQSNLHATSVSSKSGSSSASIRVHQRPHKPEPPATTTTSQGAAMSVTLKSLLTDEAWQQVGRSLSLSPRELQVARLLCDDVKEIAIGFELGISAHTVHTHIERIYGKTNVNARMELLRKIFDTLLRLTASPTSSLTPVCGKITDGTCPFRDAHGHPVDKLST
jgi:DNA-binding CsgD family transcriptional regulator